MNEPIPFSLARNRAVVLEELRRLLHGGRQGLCTTLPFGVAAVDSHLLRGGLAAGGLHEVVPETEGAGAATLGFITAILGRISFHPPERRNSESRQAWVSDRRGFTSVADPSLDCLRRSSPPLSGEEEAFPQGRRGKIILVLPVYGFHQYGRIHGHGLRALGLDLVNLILVETAHRRDSLWAMEEALHSGAAAAVAGMIDKLDLKLSQRLHLAAADAGLPLLLLRPAQNLESSAAATRWRVGTAEAARDRFGLVVRPRWRLQLERARNGRPGEWVVEYDHVAHRFSLAATLADPARARNASEKSIAKTHCA